MDRPPSRLGRHPTNDGIVFKGRGSRLALHREGLASEGAGAGVLVPGLDSGDTWFSIIWGDYADDLIALLIDERVTGPLPRERHAYDRPLGQFVDGIEEYRLSPEIQERLGLEFLDPHDYRIGKPEAVRLQLKLHDDFYGYVAPFDAPTLRAVARQHLAFHEEYLGAEGGLASYVEPLCDLVMTGDEVRLKCRRGALHVTTGESSQDRRTSTWWPVRSAR